MKSTTLFFLIISLLILTQCRPKFQDASWEIDANAPIATSSLKISDLVSDSIVTYQADSSIVLNFSSNLYSLTADSLVTINDTVFPYLATVENLVLGNQQIVYPLSLGELSSSSEAGIAGAIIISSHGSSIPFPPIGQPNPISTGRIDIDATNLFRTMTLDSGYMDLTIENGFPIDLTDIIFSLRNTETQNIILQDTFDLIPAGSSQTATYNLEGYTIEGALQAQIIEMSSPGTPVPVPIDTSDALVTTIDIRDLKPFSATAIFPTQNVVDKKEKITFQRIGGKFSQIKFKEATIEVEAVSTIEDPMYFNYQIPSATLNGVGLDVSSAVPGAPPGDTARFTKSVSLDGYTVDLRGFGPLERIENRDLNDDGLIPTPDTLNTYVQYLVGRLDSTGNIIHLSLNDSVYINVRIIDMIPDYVIGYLDKDTIQIGPSSSELDMFNKVTGGAIDLQTANVSIDISNGLGADAAINFDYLNSVGSDNQIVQLDADALNNEILLNPASETGVNDDPVVPFRYNLSLNNNNSNITDFIENLPRSLAYSFTLEQNSTINPAPGLDEILNNPPNFIYGSSGLEANLNVEIPLSFSANKLSLVDTTEVNLPENPIQNVKSASFTLIVDNEFPLSSSIEIEAIDEFNTSIFTLLPKQTIEAAKGTPSQPVSEKSILNFTLGETQILDLFDARYFVIKAELDAENITIYDTSSLNIQLTVDFKYHVNQ